MFNMREYIQNIQDDENVGAVVYEFDLNLSLLKLQKAVTYLKRKECLFICGSSDKTVPMGPNSEVMCKYCILFQIN